MPSRLRDFSEYLETLRIQIGRHGRTKVSSKDDLPNHLIGFESPEGWWAISAAAVRKAATREITLGKEDPTTQFVAWFQKKMDVAITAGERLNREGFS
jgi:hypothetical protein